MIITVVVIMTIAAALLAYSCWLAAYPENAMAPARFIIQALALGIAVLGSYDALRQPELLHDLLWGALLAGTLVATIGLTVGRKESY